MARPAGPDGHVDGHRHAPHVVPLLTYFLVFGALMLGTALTVWAAGQDFGAANTAVAMAIAVTKATLVVLFFMHVKYAERLTQLVVVVAFAFLALLILGVVNDYYSPNLEGKLRPAHLTRE